MLICIIRLLNQPRGGRRDGAGLKARWRASERVSRSVVHVLQQIIHKSHWWTEKEEEPTKRPRRNLFFKFNLILLGRSRRPTRRKLKRFIRVFAEARVLLLSLTHSLPRDPKIKLWCWLQFIKTKRHGWMLGTKSDPRTLCQSPHLPSKDALSRGPD
jgi:hypothetical protein